MKRLALTIFPLLIANVVVAGTIDTVAGSGKPGNNGDAGQATERTIDQPFGVEIGPDDALYVTEVGQHRVRRVDLNSGEMTTVAGSGHKGYRGDGGPATEAELNEPYEVRFDRAGNMLFVEMQNHLIRRVDRKSGIITTIAGTGKAGFGGDDGPATGAAFSSPHSIALDRDDNIYIADILNHRIRRIDAKSGAIETIAGTGEKKLPKAGELAQGTPVFGPRALYIVDDVLWVALREGNSVWRLPLKTGRWEDVAGTGRKGFTGDGAPAVECTFDGPKGIAVDGHGNAFVVDTENQVIRRIDAKSGMITTVAGAGPKARGYLGDGGDATAAWLDRPHGICVAADGAIYIGDTNNHRVRRVSFAALEKQPEHANKPLSATLKINGVALPNQLQAKARAGQVFLTWRDTNVPEGTTFNVYVAEQPIGNRRQARLVAHHIERSSMSDWWTNPNSFKKESTPKDDPKTGLAAQKTLDWQLGFTFDRPPLGAGETDGLFVYTVPEENHVPQGKHAQQEQSAAKVQRGTKLYFAVTFTNAAGEEQPYFMPGQNSMSDGVAASAAPIEPIWIGKGAEPSCAAGHGKPLWLSLHAKGGVVANMEYLVFGDESLGWRAGLPFKFSVRVENDMVVVRPTDRVWINRPHDEAGDGGMPAIWTFWYGYNSNIFDRSKMAAGVPTNYTERRLLWILDWVRQRYQPDPNRWYCSGSSMGGCGTISFGLRHPELFAALHAHVPIVSYTYAAGDNGSMYRFEPSCWTGKIPEYLKTSDGQTLFDRMNGTKYVEQSRADLPPVFIVHGRKDGSIPWPDNPPFYKAMAAARQPLTVYWDDGTHPTAGKDAPADVKQWQTRFQRYRRDESVVVFTNASISKNPGDGRADNGDIVGWINRGLDYRDISDEPSRYSVTLVAEGPDVSYPVTTDITLRRLQQFKPKRGDELSVRVGSDESVVRVPADGLITLPGVKIAGPEGQNVKIKYSSSK